MRVAFERRWIVAAAVAAVVVLLVAGIAVAAAGGLFEPKVKVESGTRTVCRYGHVVSQDVKTLEVAASKAANYSVNEKIVTCDRHAAIEKLNAEAQALIKKGDFKGAAAKLKEALALDPGNEDLKKQVADLEDSRKPATAGSSSGSKPSGGGEEPAGPVASLKDFVPATLEGYAAAPIVADALVLTRRYTSVSVPQVAGLVVVAEQYKDAKGAKAAIAAQKAHYSYDRSSVPSSVGSAYFGTDGRLFAFAAVNAGSIMVAVEASAKGVSPRQLKDELADVMAAITK